MSLARDLDRWREAGLIPPATVEAITGFEATRRGGLRQQAMVRWVVWLGALAVALGIVSLVASNWDRIPGVVKLSAHGAVNLSLSALIWRFVARGQHQAAELAGLLLFALILTGIALIGQVYQVAGETWAALLLWLLIATPFVALLVRGRVLSWLWLLALAWTMALAWPELAEAMVSAGAAVWLATTAMIALTLAIWLGLLVAGIAPALIAARPKLAESLRLACAIAILLLGSIAATVWGHGDTDWGRMATDAPAILIGLVAALGAIVALRPPWRWRAGWPILAAWALSVAALFSPNDESGIGSALLFIGFWGVVLRQALAADLVALARLAVIVIAGRLFLLFAIALGGLENTGWVLLAGGAVVMSAAWVLKRMQGAQP